MKYEKDKKKYESKIDTDDSFNRTLYGTPTIGGIIVIGLIIIFILYNIFS